MKEMRRHLEMEKFEIWEKSFPVQFVPNSDELSSAIQLEGNLRKRSSDCKL